jgi:hypothetical protein
VFVLRSIKKQIHPFGREAEIKNIKSGGAEFNIWILRGLIVHL